MEVELWKALVAALSSVSGWKGCWREVQPLETNEDQLGPLS